MVLTPLPPQSLELPLGPAPRCRLPFSHVWLCKGERGACVGRCVEITNPVPAAPPLQKRHQPPGQAGSRAGQGGEDLARRPVRLFLLEIFPSRFPCWVLLDEQQAEGGGLAEAAGAGASAAAAREQREPAQGGGRSRQEAQPGERA